MRTVNQTVTRCVTHAWSLAAVAALAVLGASAAAETPIVDPALARDLQRMASEAALAVYGAGPAAPRVEVELGTLDASLTLAPCQKIEPYLPPGLKPWGRTRIGLRCVQGATRWNVQLPLTVKLFTRSLVAAAALPAGTLLQPQHLTEKEVDIAASSDPAVAQAELAIGRSLARPLATGEALRRADLKARQWFAAGDLVRVVAVGAGYAVSVDGEALSPGIEGRPARVRTDAGRIITGLPTGERRMELAL